jgi:hypothetical protein
MLLAKDLHVQLKHDEEETDSQNHGYVILTAADGTVLAKLDDVQHNRNFQTKQEAYSKLVDGLDMSKVSEAA